MKFERVVGQRPQYGQSPGDWGKIVSIHLSVHLKSSLRVHWVSKRGVRASFWSLVAGQGGLRVSPRDQMATESGVSMGVVEDYEQGCLD